VISSGTVIQTDPSIRNNLVTDYGKIYRGPTDDGAFSSWAFTSTSAFDAASGIDQHFSNPANLPITAFKFTNLVLDSDPLISTANGGTTKLVLIGVNGITSAPTQATFTFEGLDTVVLATQAGSITLGDITFQNLAQIYFYARGAGSNLTLGATVLGVESDILQAEGNVQVNGAQSVNGFFVYAGNDYVAGSGAITAGAIDITAGHNVNFTTAQYPYGDSFAQTVSLRAGNAVNIDARGDLSVFNNAASIDVQGLTINVDTDLANETEFVFRLTAPVRFTANTGGFNSPNASYFHPGELLDIASDGAISVANVVGGRILNAGTSYTARFGTATQSLIAGTTINVGSDLTASSFITAGGTIDVGGQLSSPSVQASGNVTANAVTVRNLTTPATLSAGLGGLTPYQQGAGSNVLHTLNAATIRSTGGIDFSGAQFAEPSSAGGSLTLNATSISFSSTGDVQGAINFNGADAPSASAPAGSGGTFNVNTTGPLVVGSNISATTGLQDPFAAASGAGGTVNLQTTQDQVSVNAAIQVSSAEPVSTAATPAPPRRRSASGGNITLRSNAAANVAINVASSGSLLSLLDAAAPGPGGKITILATGPTSRINIAGPTGTTGAPAPNIRADRGGIEIRHTGDAGQIALSNAGLRADTIKVGALGANGTLTIGGGSINAGSMLRLYAPGSNGQLNFIANCTLSSNSGASLNLAANTITIQPNVIVNIITGGGNGGPANVYTNNPNYSGPGGTNPANGSFGGNGVTAPQPLSNAPGFDSP
jgi:hypothetical protein